MKNRIRHYQISILGFAVALFVLAANGESLESKLVDLQHQYATEFERASSLALNDDVTSANQSLLALSQKDTSPEMAFLVANMLYKMDPDAAYSLQKKVIAVYPEDPAVNLEWAMAQHRKGEYAQAIPNYQKFMATHPTDQFNALLAECLIRQGKWKDAVDAWEAAGHPHAHTAIDFAICEIHGELSPLRRRSDLLLKLGQGDLTAAEKLIDLDLNMDLDWWNSKVGTKELARDLPRVEKALGAESARYKAIQAWARIASTETPTAASVAEALKQAGCIVNQKLPENSLTASRLFGFTTKTNLMTRENLFTEFQKELLARAKSDVGDSDALSILCALSIEENTRPRLIEMDRLGWDRYGEFRFAGSLLATRASQNQLKIDDPDLVRALKQFPDQWILNSIALHIVDKKDITPQLLARAIEAEYHQLSPGIGGYPDSYTLKSYFYRLKQKV